MVEQQPYHDEEGIFTHALASIKKRVQGIEQFRRYEGGFPETEKLSLERLLEGSKIFTPEARSEFFISDEQQAAIVTTSNRLREWVLEEENGKPLGEMLWNQSTVAGIQMDPSLKSWYAYMDENWFVDAYKDSTNSFGIKHSLVSLKYHDTIKSIKFSFTQENGFSLTVRFDDEKTDPEDASLEYSIAASLDKMTDEEGQVVTYLLNSFSRLRDIQ